MTTSWLWQYEDVRSDVNARCQSDWHIDWFQRWICTVRRTRTSYVVLRRRNASSRSQNNNDIRHTPPIYRADMRRKGNAAPLKTKSSTTTTKAFASNIIGWSLRRDWMDRMKEKNDWIIAHDERNFLFSVKFSSPSLIWCVMLLTHLYPSIQHCIYSNLWVRVSTRTKAPLRWLAVPYYFDKMGMDGFLHPIHMHQHIVWCCDLVNHLSRLPCERDDSAKDWILLARSSMPKSNAIVVLAIDDR